ncbi:pyridoxal phosphate-dependent aminotransferase [bacterium]|nr:MAG: pyridoxal phosphate-dependent aminotransferase [bacterium]
MRAPARFSSRARTVPPSATSAATEAARALAERGISVVALSEGEPDALTPPEIRRAAYEAIEAGYTKYPPLAGYPDLRQAIAEALHRRGVEYSADGIVVSCGAKQAILNTLLALVDAGDEVIIPTPAWVSYAAQVTLVGGKPVSVETRAEDGFILDPERLRAKITPRTVALVINSPCNPTGAVYAREQLEELATVALEHDLWIISDEIYSALTYADKAVSFAALGNEVARRTVLIDGASKTFAMTGWRVGWSICEPAAARVIVTMQGQTTSGAAAMAQRATLAALRMDRAAVDAMLDAYKRRRSYVLQRLERVPGITCSMPGGAFYVFPDVRELLGGYYGTQRVDSSQTLAELLLSEVGLAVVAGEAFVAPGYIRISFAASDDQIAEGCDRLERFVRALRPSLA